MRQTVKQYYQNRKTKYGLSLRQINLFGFKLALDVYERYGRKCSVCGDMNNLQIHHIDRKGSNYLKKGLKPNNDFDNLQLICIKCHGSLSSRVYWEEQARLRGGYLKKGKEKEYLRVKSRESYLRKKGRK